MATQLIRITHWIPFITFCPVNKLPDFIYVTAEFDQVAELYEIRRLIRKAIKRKPKPFMFMEEICLDLFKELEKVRGLTAVEVRLAFNRHFVRITR